MKEIDSVGFEVGYDMRRYGQPKPVDLAKSLQDGWDAADINYQRHKEIADRAVLRWLQLRRNAHKRSVFFDPAVTPDFLGLLGVEYCPVTGLLLTTGTGKDTDGSIDRVLNSHGYTQGNLVMMSVRANQAKGQLSPQDIAEIVVTQSACEGLSHQAWKTLLYITKVATEAFRGKRRKFLTGEVHIAGLPYGLGADVQAAITSLAAVNDTNGIQNHPVALFFTMLHEDCIRKSSKKLCMKMAKDLSRSGIIGSGSMNWDYWSTKKNQSQFERYWESLLPHDKKNISRIMIRLRATGNVSDTPSKTAYSFTAKKEQVINISQY